MLISPNPRCATKGLLLLLALGSSACGGGSPQTEAGVDTAPTESSAGTTSGETATTPAGTDTMAETSTSTTETDGSSSSDTQTEPELGDPCNPGQPNCPEGQKCAPVAGDEAETFVNRCVLLTADKPAGEACTLVGELDNYDDCGFGHLCWSLAEAGPGTCVLQSSDSVQGGCPPGHNNHGRYGGVVTICLPTCDPRVDTCPNTLECWYTSEDFVCDWLPQQSVPEGQPCADNDSGECNPGLYCVSGGALEDCEAERCCTPFCSTDDPGSCGGGLVCQVFSGGGSPEGLETLGLCVTPP